MQILNRRQLPHESFEEFYNVILKLRHQQKFPYDERSLIDIMRGNLKPALAQLMFPIRINSLTEFCYEVKRAENLLANQRQNYQQRPNFARVNEIEVTPEEEDVVPILEVDAMQNTSKYTCWNCKMVVTGNKPFTYASTDALTAGGPTTATSTAPVLPHEVSISSDDSNSTIRSPEYSSLTAQNVRREVRESLANQRNQDSNIQEVINASIGLSQAQFMRQVDDKINDALMEIKRALGINQQQQQNIPVSADPTVPLQEAQARGPEFLNGAVTQASSLPPVTRSLVAPVISQVSYPHGNIGGREVTSVTYTQPQPAVTQGLWSNPPPPLFPAPNYMANEIQRRDHTDFPEPNLNQTRYFEQQPMNQTPINPPRVGQQQQQAYNQQQQAYNQQQQHGYSQQQQGYSYHQLPLQQQHNLGPAPNYAWPMSNGIENHPRVNLSKWGIKFDGTSKSMNAQEFIFRINELRKDYDCSDMVLFQFIIFIVNLHK
ncbi:hypothetical protein CVS40_6628 [Lucilia cuprina]|nr:hypothetical protein CVS40_6628 [Lucilia cuprina]